MIYGSINANPLLSTKFSTDVFDFVDRSSDVSSTDSPILIEKTVRSTERPIPTSQQPNILNKKFKEIMKPIDLNYFKDSDDILDKAIDGLFNGLESILSNVVSNLVLIEKFC